MPGKKINDLTATTAVSSSDLIIVQKGSGSAQQATVSQLEAALSLGAITSIVNMSDVSVSTLAENHALLWRTSELKFKNVPILSETSADARYMTEASANSAYLLVDTTLDEIANVSIVTPATLEVLTYNAVTGNWYNVSAAAVGGGGVTAFTSLTDTSVDTSLAANQILTYDGTDWINNRNVSIAPDGSVAAIALGISGNTSIGGTLNVAGNTSLTNLDINGTLNTSGDTSIGGTLDVTGDTSLTNTDINGTLDVSGNTSIGGTLDVTGVLQVGGNVVLDATTTLDEIASVSIVTPATLEVLSYNALTGNWYNTSVAGGGGVTTFTSLTDTSVDTSLVANQVLTYDGTDWINNRNVSVAPDGSVGVKALYVNGDVTVNSGDINITGGNLRLTSFNTGIVDFSGNELIDFQYVSLAVDFLQVINATAGSNVRLSAAGDSTDVGIEINSKGTGIILLGGDTSVSASLRVAGNLVLDTTTTLDEVANVSIVTPATLEVLTYNGATGNWTNVSSAGGGGGFDPDVSAITIGFEAINPIDGNGIVIGTSARCSSSTGLAIGHSSWVNSNYAIAIGTSARSIAEKSIAIGKSTLVNSSIGICIGASAGCNVGGIGIGNFSYGYKDSVGIGRDTQNFGVRSVVIGAYSSVAFGLDEVILIGTSLTATTSNQIIIGKSTQFTEIPGDFYAQSLPIEVISTVAFQLSAGHSGSILHIDTSATAICSINAGQGIGGGFNVTFTQVSSASPVLVCAEAGIAINHRLGHTKTAGQYAVADLYMESSTVGYFSGDTA